MEKYPDLYNKGHDRPSGAQMDQADKQIIGEIIGPLHALVPGLGEHIFNLKTARVEFFNKRRNGRVHDRPIR